ncbi:RDD family protein [Flavobacterium jejuense]|uniref:RDD family protein n=1 Tax=Flavobacterium jejuense TaxID=1544455 RepID=A0ABX0IWG6_9FLAO|nr:RDD family protein [Flavobacterium jejuense]NHN27535.1 RDD family protein [Flavobacterium jejuense]
MIEYKLATRRERFVAFLVDATIGVLLFLTFYYFWGDKSDSGEISVTGLPAFVLFLLNFLIWPVLEGFNGQTIGKKLVGLKVVNDNFKDISMG